MMFTSPGLPGQRGVRIVRPPLAHESQGQVAGVGAAPLFHLGMTAQQVRTMHPARPIVVALAFLWVPWTSDAGYLWLRSKPQPRVIQNGIVADARQRWDLEHRPIDVATVGEEWVRAVQPASAEDKDRLKQEPSAPLKWQS